MSAEPTEREVKLVCRRCGREIECCAFCERGDCTQTICYRCLREQLKQNIAVLHRHGG